MSETSSHKPAPISPFPPAASGSSYPTVGGRPAPSAEYVDGEQTVISSRVPGPSLSIGRAAAPLESGSLLEGEQLGQFILQKFIGGGGMGVVFRALDTTLNREVAVKVLSRNQSADEEALRRFRNEAQSAARLDHHNIARVHYVGEDRGVHYIVFEFIEGVNLRDMVEQRGPLPWDEAVSYTYQIAEALDHASQRAVIHRDIKPSNVLITPDGKAKLVDMGLARLHQVAHTDDLTASGVTLGTFDYISPEQARDPRNADVRSDLYSLGCSFYYTLTARPPFPDGTVLQKLLQHQADVPPDPRSVRPELPPEITRILNRLLAKNPANRYQQPAELAHELAELSEKLGMPLSSPRIAWTPRVEKPTRPWQRHLPWMLPLAALFLIVFALDNYWSATAADEESVSKMAPVRAKVLDPSPPIATSPAAVENAAASPRTEGKSRSAAAPQAPGTTEIDGETPPEAGLNLDQKPVGEPRLETLPWLERFASSALGQELGIDRLVAKAESNASNRLASKPLSPDQQPKVSAEAAQAAAAPGGAPKPPMGTREGVLIVGDAADGVRSYSTLLAACAEAKSGDTIELRFNGRRTERPITLPGVQLRIRAGEGYHPVVAFQPQPDPFRFSASFPSMVTIAKGECAISDVQWELDLPRSIGADCALFEVRRNDLLSFQRCTFTIRNASLGQTAYHSGVAFFDIKAPLGNGSMAMDPTEPSDQPVQIELHDCIARGEATLVRSNELQPLKFTWDNGLLAVSERLLTAAGGATRPNPAARTLLRLQHVTAVVPNGLALLTNSESEPYELTTAFSMDDCVVAGRISQPLVEQRGSDSIAEFAERFAWSGERNYFSDVETFWKIVGVDTETGSKQMRFGDWQRQWAKGARLERSGPEPWQNPLAEDKPFHGQTPADYMLNSSDVDNPALGGASDGGDLGFVMSRLPQLPAMERRESSPNSRPTRASSLSPSDS